MGQIVGGAAKPKRCNINQLSQLGTPAAGEYILVSSDNSMNAAGQGNFDCYIEGDGHTAATELPLLYLDQPLYNTTGDAVDGAMTQQAVTRELAELDGIIDDNLFEYHDVTYDKMSGVVWTRGAIDDSGNDVASLSKVRNTGYLPIKNKHVFTYGSVALYTIYLYDFDYRYIGKVTELTDDSDIDARAAWIRIVAGQGSPYVYPSTMENDDWSWTTQKPFPIIPTLQELVEPLNELVDERMELRKIDVDEVLRADNKKIYDFNLNVNGTTEYVAQALIHLDEGDYIVRKNGAPTQATIFAKSSSDSEIVSGAVAYLKTANPDGDYEMTLDDGYYLITINMVTNTPYVTFWQQGKISVKGITSNATAIDAIHSFVEPIGITTFGNCVQTSEAFTSSDGFRFVTIKGCSCDKPSLLDSIKVGVTGDGVMRFFVGKIDQRNAAMDIKDRYFDVAVEDGIHTYDVSDNEIILESGEYLFCYISYYGNAVLNKREHSAYYTPDTLRPLLSKATDETNVVVEQTNSDVTLLWSVSLVKSIFAYKSQIKELEGKVEAQSAELNKAGIVYDDNGAPYSLRVVNGSIVPKTMRFTKVLAIGNSLTDHPYNTGVNWLTHGYSMAATSLETSWTYQFQRVLRQYNPSAEVKGFSLYNWEANPLIDVSDIRSSDTRQEDIRYLRDELTTDLDCVIFRAGENGNPSMADFETGLCNLVEYIQEKSPNATILMCNMFWHVASKEEVISKVASKYGLKFIDCGNVGYRREIVGGFCWNEDKSDMFMINNSPVGIHTSDEGFYLFANRLASACGLEELPNEIHNVDITSSVSYTVKSKFGVKGGLISIITSDRQTVVVTDSQGNNIPVAIKDITDQHVIAPDFVAVFTMPDDDVDVVIS